jgi:hypothetical protein
MTTPQQRMARMRKSFDKNKSVLAEDYKYFTPPDAPELDKHTTFLLSFVIAGLVLFYQLVKVC